jgi:hypothetical protein
VTERTHQKVSQLLLIKETLNNSKEITEDRDNKRERNNNKDNQK